VMMMFFVCFQLFFCAQNYYKARKYAKSAVSKFPADNIPQSF